MSAVKLTHTNALRVEKIDVPDPARVEIIRDGETPFGMQTYISIPGRGTLWVDGDRAEVRSKLGR